MDSSPALSEDSLKNYQHMHIPNLKFNPILDCITRKVLGKKMGYKDNTGTHHCTRA